MTNWMYASMPKYIRYSKKLTNDEKMLWCDIRDNMVKDAKGNIFSIISNEELAKLENVSEKTISTRIASLKEKGYINLLFETRKHRRRIYITLPKSLDPTQREQLTEEETTRESEELQKALRQGIILGNLSFETIVEKILDSSFLLNLPDNSTQFALNSEQIEFLYLFKKRFPNKNIDCQVASFPNVNLDELLKSIQESEFLMQNDNLSLKWMFENSEEIIAGKYKSYLLKEVDNVKRFDKNFKGRTYSKEYLESLYTKIEDIDV